MNGQVAVARARWTLAVVFTVFLLANVVSVSMLFTHHLPPHFESDVPIGMRLGLVLLACVIAYVLAQMLYKLLVRETVPASDAAQPAMSLLAYLVLIAATFGFLGLGSWLWLPVLFLLVVIWTVLSLWHLLGWKFMIGILVLAIAVGVLSGFMLT